MVTAGQKNRTVFFGWWVVFAAGVGLALHAGPVMTATFGVFFKPLSQEFGWTRAEVSLAFSLFTLVVAGALVVVGRLVDHFGARKVILLTGDLRSALSAGSGDPCRTEKQWGPEA
jgi:MFS family permease